MQPSTRLYVILARKSPRAVIFRRGPSKQVQLIAWNTERDTFKPGQWFKGRIYERRCDLSPDGDLLIYFAAKNRLPLYSWTAISRPPYLTAMAWWPKGDGWGGGGLFKTERRVMLNHRPGEMELASGFHMARRIKTDPLGVRPGWGEDFPIWAMRLARDGWSCTCEGEERRHDLTDGISWEYDPPMTWQRPHPSAKNALVLEMQIHGINERNAAWYQMQYVVRTNSGAIDDLGRTEWADWDKNGDLLFAQQGALFRCAYRKPTLTSSDEAIQIADFSGNRFENVETPASALLW